MKNKNIRSPEGQSLVELLVATLVFSAVSTVMLGLYSINTVELSGFWNRGDILTSVTDGIARVGLLVRSARGFGENYGVVAPEGLNSQMFNWNNLLSGSVAAKMAGINTNISTGGILNGSSFAVSQSFPTAGDLYYGTGVLPGTIYGGNWPMTNPPQLGAPSGPGAPAPPGYYTLAQDCLIIQVPVFVGTPVGGGGVGVDPSSDINSAQSPYIWPATYNGVAAVGPPLQAVDTYVFRVLPDPNYPGTSQMQECAFPANPSGGINPSGVPSATYNGHPTNVTLNTNTPATIIKGIVGPLDVNGNISTFSYVDRIDNQATNIPPANNLFLTDYAGCIVNLEVLRNQEGSKNAVAAFKTEFYIRNNTQVVLEGPPQD